MITAIVSILIITLAVWLVNKKLPFKICPICAGVALTWLWLLIGMLAGNLSATSYQLPIAILMGGTVVGLMSKLEKFIKPNFGLLWKTVFVISGFSAFYSLITNKWLFFTIAAFLALVATFSFKKRRIESEKEKTEQAKELEEKMKKCC